MKRCLFLSVALVSAAPVLAADDGFKTARAMVMAAHPGECESDIAERFEKLEGDVFEVSWPYKRYDGTVETLKGRLYEITCGVGAYNISVAYVFARENGFPEEGEIVAFAAPSYSLEYEKDDDTYTKLASDPAVTGFEASTLLVNPHFDPDTSTISSYAKWRGIGDAYSVGEWRLEDGVFVLKRYLIDPIYEANIDDPPDDLRDTQFVIFEADD